MMKMGYHPGKERECKEREERERLSLKAEPEQVLRKQEA